LTPRDLTRALVVKGGLRRQGAVALLLEATRAIALARPVPAFNVRPA
jgi:hypothetical protein